MFYHRKLSKYKYKTSIFEELIEFANSKNAKWKSGHDQNGLSWNVEELQLNYNDFSILHKVFGSINLEFKRPSFFLSKVLSGGLSNHIDHRKWGNLGFPLTGDFTGTKINFHDPFNQIVEILDFNESANKIHEPFIINTRMTHSVSYARPPKTERVTLMMDIFEWPGHVFEKVDNELFFSKPNKLFL